MRVWEGAVNIDSDKARLTAAIRVGRAEDAIS